VTLLSSAMVEHDSRPCNDERCEMGELRECGLA
jgi:hypothetical protein